MKTQTKYTNLKEQDNNCDNYITVYQNFQQLNHSHSRGISFLLGRGYESLRNNHGLTLEQIGECFGTTKQNVWQCINIYLANRPSNSDIAAPPSQAPAINHATACVESATFCDEDPTTISGAIALSERSK